MRAIACLIYLFTAAISISAADWPQLQGDALRSGNAPHVRLPSELGLKAAIPLSDAIYAAPIVGEGNVFVIDGAGLVTAIDCSTHQIKWQFQTRGTTGNCNNMAAPALFGRYLHVATMMGDYYVLDCGSGAVVRQLNFGEPIFASPVAGQERVYVATLGAQVHALMPDGEEVWHWDFVREVIKFPGDRWNGSDWLAFRGDRVTWKDHFVCSRDICLVDQTIVMPAGGRTVFLEDTGQAPKLAAVAEIPAYLGKEFPATFGQSADQRGRVYVQWHRRDNAGRVEMLWLQNDGTKSEVQTSVVPGTETSIDQDGLLSFASVAVRDDDVYRVRPEQGRGLMRHQTNATDSDQAAEVLCEAASICPPVITQKHIVYGDLHGKLHIVPIDGEPNGETATTNRSVQSLDTAFGAPITAPPAIANQQIYVGCEDGYLYIFGAGKTTAYPTTQLSLTNIRSPRSGPYASEDFNWYTNYGDFGGTNANDQGLAPPLRMRWARRLEGTVKHLPVCGGGRIYMHTAEGQIIAAEQDTGRLLWRRYWPDVYLSFTSPLYVDGKLLVPQAGIKRSMMRCLDAETGDLLWETPFTGSPSWSRQFPPVVNGNVAIYASGSGSYAAQGTEKPFTFRGKPVQQGDREVMSWIYSNDNPFYPKDHHPRIWAWDLNTGKVVWEKDFSNFGRGGNDCGICLLDGKLYYSVFFGYAEQLRRRRGLPAENNGLTACLDPANGDVIWSTTDYYVTSKCTLSGRDGRLYIGGFNRAQEGTDDRFVWCLNANDGSLFWKSDPVTSALNVVTVGEQFVFSNALRGKGNVFDRSTGKVTSSIGHNYACCRFTLSEPYVLGANMDMIDLSNDGKLVSTGPAIDSRECLGAVVSNGRIFYMSQASGLVVSQTYGQEAKAVPPVWKQVPEIEQQH